MNQSQLSLALGDASMINAAFPLPASAARRLLPGGPKPNLVEVFPGRAVLVVSFAHYRQTQFGAYSELVLALLATHTPAIPMLTLTRLLQESRYPAYVLHMPVSNAAAADFGVKHWGLPRVFAEVELAEQTDHTICTTHLDGQLLLRMTATRPNTDRPRTMQIESYSQRDGRLLHALMPCNARAYGSIQAGGARLEWGSHQLAARFMQAGIAHDPLMLRYYEHLDATLYGPTSVA